MLCGWKTNNKPLLYNLRLFLDSHVLRLESDNGNSICGFLLLYHTKRFIRKEERKTFDSKPFPAIRSLFQMNKKVLLLSFSTMMKLRGWNSESLWAERRWRRRRTHSWVGWLNKHLFQLSSVVPEMFQLKLIACSDSNQWERTVKRTS